jgi:hypothetical protein
MTLYFQGSILETIDIQQFYVDFRQEVALEATREGAERPTAEAFAGVMIDELSAANVFDDATIAPFRARGMEVSGYSLSDDLEDLTVLVSVFKQSPFLETTTSTEIDTAINRAMGFLSKVRLDLLKTVEESTPAFDMILAISEAFPSIRKARIVVITDGQAIIKEREKLSWYAREVLVEVWDIRRLYQLAASGKPQEPIDIDFVKEFGEAVPCLASPIVDPDYQAHLAIFPGAVLAEIYEKYGGRLLERNVRAFLQARGKVNSGIRKTILEEPERFLAYNNGISATASAIDFIDLPNGGRGISKVRDLQIVNGGQTTASIHHVAKRDRDRSRVDLSKLSVQAKLTIVPPSKLNEIVPLISRYANSQNKVNEADFEANSPFHVAIEHYSRRIWAPARAGEPRMTHWFYERARGQYADALSRELTTAKKRDFKLVNPLNQKFTKTDLARFVNCWSQLPHIASQGAEKNFRYFTMERTAELQNQATQQEFQDIVAMAILYRQTEKIITQRAYGGYRANTVAYTISLLSKLLDSRLDFNKIWIEQSLDADLSRFIGDLSEPVREVLVAAPGNGNVTEWCKKRECWKVVSEISAQVPEFVELTSTSNLNSIEDLGEAILSVLRSRGYPMDRSSIIREIGLTNKEWTETIRELTGAGLLIKIGKASETLYSLSDN